MLRAWYYASSAISYTYYKSTGKISGIRLSYNYSTSEISSMKTRYQSAMTDMLSWVKPNETDFGKAKAVHDWLIYYCSYNQPAADAGSLNYSSYSPWSAYGALVEHKPVCQGFSLAFMAAMRVLGIPCTYVSQRQGSDGHGWNRAYLVNSSGVGAWYNIDVTFDDSGTNSTTVYCARYFAKSDTWWRSNSYDGWHSTWSPAGVAATNTTYDRVSDSFWVTFTGPASTPRLYSFTLSKSSMTMGTYSSATIKIASTTTSTGANNYPTHKATWSSDKPDIAAVDRTGRITTGGKTGTATITCSLGGYTRTCKVTVGARNISGATVAAVSNQQYTGSAIKPNPKVTYSGQMLEKGVDYTVSYSNNVKRGTATITITGKGNYTGTKKVTFKIVQRNMSTATVSAVYPQMYTGKARTQMPTVKAGGRTLTAGTDYTISYKNNVKVGTATMTITGKGNYTGTKSVTFKIEYSADVWYCTHVQRVGWQDWVRNGALSGTTGRSLRLEGTCITLMNNAYTGGITYRTHVQRIGWQGWRSNGTMSGTSGQSLRLEAIEIKLTGEMANHYDVYYRVHVQHFGWTGWAKNGQSCGSAGYSYRLEGIQIRLVPKGGKAPGSTANRFHQK